MAGPTTAGYAAQAAGEPWHYVGETGEPAFESDWANSADPDLPRMSFRLREAGIVDLVGYVYSGTYLSTAIFILPADYRPTSGTTAMVPIVVNGSPIRARWLLIYDNGRVEPVGIAVDEYMIISGSFFLTSPPPAP